MFSTLYYGDTLELCVCLAPISLCIIRFVVIVAIVVYFYFVIFDSSLCSFVLMAARAHVHPHNNCPRKKNLQRHTHQAGDYVSAKKNNQMIRLFQRAGIQIRKTN